MLRGIRAGAEVDMYVALNAGAIQDWASHSPDDGHDGQGHHAMTPRR